MTWPFNAIAHQDLIIVQDYQRVNTLFTEHLCYKLRGVADVTAVPAATQLVGNPSLNTAQASLLV